MNFRIYVANLRAYTEGELIGEWIDLPMETEKLWSKLDSFLNDGEDEYAIHDYETDLGIRIKEYSSIDSLNDLAMELDLLSDEDLKIFAGAIEELGDDEYCIEQALAFLCNGEYAVHSDIHSYRDLGYYVMEELAGLKDWQIELLADSIDFDNLGRDHKGYSDITCFFVDDVGYVEFHGNV